MIIHDVSQGSDEWFGLRAGKPTASNAKMLVTGTGKASVSIKDYGMVLGAEMYAGKPLDTFEGNEWTERGNELEEAALDAYEQSSDTWMDRVGFCTNDNNDYGASPDGLGAKGMVEIKCLGAKKYMKVITYYNQNKKAMPDYISQPQMQMLVCGREWCDLTFYHPDLPLLIIRQHKIPAFQEMLISQLQECIKIRDAALEIIKELN